MDVGSVENLVDQGCVFSRHWLPFCTLRGKRMYGYAASALRFSLARPVSCVTSGSKVVGNLSISRMPSVPSGQRGRAFGGSVGLVSSPQWYEIESAESNSKERWVPGWLCNLRSMKEAVGFLHPIDATAVMRGSSGLPRSTRSVC